MADAGVWPLQLGPAGAAGPPGIQGPPGPDFTLTVANLTTRTAALETVTHYANAPTGVPATDRAHLQALIDAGGEIVLRETTTTNYKVDAPGLNANGKTGVTIRGPGSGNATNCTIEYTSAGAGNLLSLTSAIGLRFAGVRFLYSNAAYTGRLIQAAGGGADAGSLTFARCVFQGASSTIKNATALLSLKQTLTTTIHKCLFAWADVGIELGNASYAISITVSECVWSLATMTSWCIKVNGSFETLNIGPNNTFEGLSAPNAAGGTYIQTSSFSRALNYVGNWHGDAVGGGVWLKIDHTANTGVLGLKISANRFASPGAGGTCVSINHCTGALIAGNDFEGPIGLAFTAATPASAGVAIVGNRFSNTTALSGEANLSGYDIIANNGLADKLSNGVISGHAFQVTGASTPAAGAGVEINYSAGVGNAIAFDRTGGAWRPMSFGGSVVDFKASGAERIKVDGTGIGFYAVAPVARAAAIASPTADVAALKTAVDALRVALTNIGITS
jgi:hypothetical protein